MIGMMDAALAMAYGAIEKQPAPPPDRCSYCTELTREKTCRITGERLFSCEVTEKRPEWCPMLLRVLTS